MIQDKYITLQEVCERAFIDAQHWPAVCDEAAVLFDGVGSIFLPITPKGRGPWLSFSSSITKLIEQYIQEEWYLNDYRERGTEYCIRNGYMTDHDFISRDEMEKLPYYTDLLFKHDVGICIAMHIQTPNGTWAIAIQCNKDRAPLTKEEIEVTKQVTEILQAATQKAEEQSREKLQNFISLLGETKNDVLILDGDGEIIQQHNGMNLFSKVNNAKLGKPFKHVFDSTVHVEIDEVCSCPTHENKQTNFIHDIDGQKVSFNLMQIPQSIRHYYSRAKIIVLTSRVSTSDDKIKHILGEIYDLTPAEVIAANLLAQGNSLLEIAEHLALAEGTIRQRFKSIYSKTGTSSQAQLVSFMFNMVK